jgi:hypothetical protein
VKQLHPALHQDSEAYCLLDWVSLEEVSKMQREAYNEMAEMQVRISSDDALTIFLEVVGVLEIHRQTT